MTAQFKNFNELLSLVKGKPNRVIVPGANNEEALKAIKMADDNGLISGGILIGPEKETVSTAKENRLKLDKFEIVPSDDIAHMCDLAVDFLVEGKGDFLLKGLVDTKFYLKSILNKEKGLVKPTALLSHSVLFETERYKKLFIITDGAVIVNPTVEQKAKIIENSVAIMQAMGIEKPKVSLVCPIEKVNPKIQSTVDAAELVRLNKEGKIKNCVVEGPYDIYITFSREKALEKGVTGGEVPGDADIVVLPDLNSANAVYKSLAFFVKNIKAAAVVSGVNIPVILPSRVDAPEVKFNSIALCSHLKGKKLN